MHGLCVKKCGKSADFYPASSAPLVDQYLAANGIVLGKANLGELQSGYATNPTSNGITTALNPYDPTRTSSGKSIYKLCADIMLTEF